MLFVCNRQAVVAAALLLFSFVDATTITTAPKAASTADAVPATCESRTINYITDSLPQQCLKSSWSNSNGTSSTIAGTMGNSTVAGDGQSEGTIVPSSEASNATKTEGNDSQEDATLNETALTTSSLAPTATETEVTEESPTDIESGELNEASFLSFEDWKKQTLEKAGQANTNIGNKKSGAKRDSESIQNNLDSLGDEGEIELDFGAFRSGGNGEESSESSETKEPDAQASQDLDGTGRKGQHRNSDAGKTCKERFSYASFDAGATILKTHPGAKNSKAVLIENKDSYMLSECATENKFLIVELSEDIWIDTVVLANYEFFSSMIRTFRVSVSDRYPVKMEKWKDLGVYEARNSREIQAFLIENPQIWARYLRIEFLSHYGNEYYCPLSLLRVHGQRMLESWKETEAGGDEDDIEEVGGGDEQYVPDAVAEVIQEEERLIAELKGAQAAIDDLVKTAALISDQVDTALTSSYLEDVKRSLADATTEQNSTPWISPELEIFASSNMGQEMEVCLPSDAPSPVAATPGPETESSSIVELDVDKATATDPPSAGSAASPSPTPAATSQPADAASESSSPEASSVVASNWTSITSSIKESMSSAIASAANKTSLASPSPQTNKTAPTTPSQKNKTTSTTSSTSSLPTIQESFFKSVSRRLHLLETNSTLSLKYIEEQSKILREAFTKVEKKQLQKTTTFLDTLNSTVLAELRGFRQQYDEIWQSTIISLESQREESRREILAISTRLNILADEVVFQKRMSIVQSVLLLLCLGLVIFSRVSAAGHLDFPAMQARARNFGFPLSPLESPPESPEYRRTGIHEDRQWLETGDRAQRDGSPVSRSRSGEDDDSPPTPVSFYSRSENALTPPSGADDMAGSTGNLVEEQLEVPSSSGSKYLDPPTYVIQEPSDEQFRSSPTVLTPKKRKAFIRRQSNPLQEDSEATGDSSPEQSRDTYDAGERTVGGGGPSTGRSPPLPSPPRGKERQSFSIVRKPLPALPTDGN